GHARGHIVDHEVETDTRLGAIAVGGGDRHGLALGGTVVGAKRPGPGAVAVVHDGAGRNGQGDRIRSWVAEGAEVGGALALVHADGGIIDGNRGRSIVDGDRRRVIGG